MFTKVFRYKHYTKELTTGPLSPFLNKVARHLFERGHSRQKVRNKFVVLGQLSRWIRRRRLVIEQLDDSVIKKFLRLEARRVVWSLSERGDIASLKLLIEILQKDGVIPAVKTIKLTPSDQVLIKFENHLSINCGIKPETVYNYKRYAGFFIKFKFRNGEHKWDDVSIKDMYAFMLQS